ncbi:MAG: Na+/H+ antiporter NhaC family protein, partial [Clostridia bacterium]|nr:Na+/H+ antiporter NhaC family protein [Clostridia bacterium]
MDPVNVGILSILPPIIAIALALLTKEVISSLIIGILSGTLIYSIASGLNPIIGTVETTFNLMTGRMDVGIILFLCLLGALVVVTGMAGGSRAYGRWAASKIKGKRSAMLATGALGILIFIDDYFNCLTVGTVMKPVTDKYGISRSKLSYIIDATAAPICIIAPISSWAAAVGSNIAATGMYESELSAFIATIPFNLYAILSIVMVAFLCISKLDFGPMRKAELKAAKGDLGAVDTNIESEYKISDKGTIWDMLVPVIALIVFSVLEMLYTGGLWGDDPAYHSLAAAFGNCSPTPSLIVGGFAALVVAFVMYIPRKVVSFRDFMNGITIGVKSMVPACIILTLAWT